LYELPWQTDYDASIAGLARLLSCNTISRAAIAKAIAQLGAVVKRQAS